VRERDLFGHWAQRWRIVRTSNAYVFRDPLPCAEGRGATKSENATGTLFPEISVSKANAPAQTDDLANMNVGLLKTLHSLGTAIAKKTRITVT
jgi:hypothetical protein